MATDALSADAVLTRLHDLRARVRDLADDLARGGALQLATHCEAAAVELAEAIQEGNKTHDA